MADTLPPCPASCPRITSYNVCYTKLLRVKTEDNKDIEGMNIADIATKRGKSIVDTVCELMIDERGEA